MALPAKPSDPVEWATDATYSSGDDVGLDTKLAPTSGEVASGYHRGKRPPARKFNWFLNNVGLWVQWAEDALDYAEATLSTLTSVTDGLTAENMDQSFYGSLESAAVAPSGILTITEIESNGPVTNPWQVVAGGGGSALRLPGTTLNAVYRVDVEVQMESNSTDDPETGRLELEYWDGTTQTPIRSFRTLRGSNGAGDRFTVHGFEPLYLSSASTSAHRLRIRNTWASTIDVAADSRILVTKMGNL